MHEFLATAAFSLEGIVKNELAALGAEGLHITPFGVAFTGDLSLCMRANLHLRTSERVKLKVGEFDANTFDMLFDGIKALPWENYIADSGAFPVSVTCAKSALMSEGDCRAIAKKAIADRLIGKRRISRLSESGIKTEVVLHIHQNRVLAALNASGNALSRRGYRVLNGAAPLRETLAAACVILSGYKKGMAFCDPMCGTGTLGIEAAMIASNRAPGLDRCFDMEEWSFVDKAAIKRERQRAEDAFDKSTEMDILLNDIDPEAIKQCKFHVKRAGFGGRVKILTGDARDLGGLSEGGVFCVNPPYGKRISAAGDPAAVLAGLFRRNPTWRLCAITSDFGLEKTVGQKAGTQRRVYNGRDECAIYVFSKKSIPATAR